MTISDPRAGDRPRLGGRRAPGLVLASRGDALTEYLFEALARRYPIDGRLAPELSHVQRLNVAAGTFRPSRSRWVEQFYKSDRAYRMRSANAARQHSRLTPGTGLVFQVHALFEVPDARSVLYVDCTHQQSATQWPDWNPLRGRALEEWYEREGKAYRAAAHVFAFSRPTRDSLVDGYGVPAARVSVVGAGLNLRQLPPAPEPVDEFPADPTILFVGNDFSRKGGHVLLEAFRRVRHEWPRARLQLVGTPAQIAPQPGVEVLGRINDRARLAALYRRASVFCLPSFFDPFGLVLLEAMAHSVPVVSTPSCGIPDIISSGRDGLLVPGGDASATADALLSVLSDPARHARLAAAGRERVSGYFTWDRVVDRMAPVLDELVAS